MENIKVKNRGAATVIYTIPEMGVRREFTPGEIKEIPQKELQALSYVPGGEEIITNFLQVTDSAVLNAMNISVEPEYFYDEEKIKDLLVNGSMDQFLDTLDFAPESVLELIKAYAVSLPLNDSAKREAIKNKLHFDVDNVLKMQTAIANDESMGEGADITATGKTRRTTVSTAPKYKVIK